MSEERARLRQEVEELRAKNKRLWDLMQLPALKREALLADIPLLIATFYPHGEGPDYATSRILVAKIALAVKERIEEVSKR